MQDNVKVKKRKSVCFPGWEFLPENNHKHVPGHLNNMKFLPLVVHISGLFTIC